MCATVALRMKRRALLLPGGLNEKVIEKIGRDEVWRRRVQPELGARFGEPRVLLCYDGFGKGTERNAKWTTDFSSFSWAMARRLSASHSGTKTKTQIAINTYLISPFVLLGLWPRAGGRQ